ncbi:MAG: aminotransferase-like domain-containing protein [Candidatus Ranarchaeia archaeon]|jgi:2-aminoadipate transaminase
MRNIQPHHKTYEIWIPISDGKILKGQNDRVNIMKEFSIPFAEWTKTLPESEIRRLLKYNVEFYYGGGKPGCLPITLFSKLLRNVADRQESLIKAGKTEEVLNQYNYGPTPGYRPLREVLAERVKKVDRVHFPTDNPADSLSLTTGSQQMLYMILDVLINPGDIILTPSPAYLGFLAPAHKLQGRIVTIETDSEGIIPEAIEKTITIIKKTLKKKPKVLYLVTDSDNPKGTSVPLQRRKAIFDLCEAEDILIIEDNPYREIQFEQERILPIKSFDEENQRVAYLRSTSKEAVVFRVGYSVLPEPLQTEVMKDKGYLDLCSPILTQIILTDYYKNHIDVELPKTLENYKKRRDAMVGAMEDTFPEGEFTRPKGGFFTWWESENKKFNAGKFLVEKALPNQIIYTSGEAFYPIHALTLDDSSTKLKVAQKHYNTMRLSFSFKPPDNIHKGISRLGNLLSEDLS